MLVTKVNPEHTALIERKVGNVNAELAVPDDPELAASISVGVAFGDENALIKNVFKRADNALYDVKQSGRGGCKFAE